MTSALGRPITEVIENRFSCRIYLDEPIGMAKQIQLQEYLATITSGPLGTPMRYQLVAATQQDRNSLKGLGPYGCIQGGNGFMIGAIKPHVLDLEDYGYVLEKIILYATDLDLGTCWLGGNFVRSNFSKKIGLLTDERLPAVASVGLIKDPVKARQTLARRMAKADQRLDWEYLFFDGQFGNPLDRAAAGAFTVPLDMVRLAPSAKNYQPWRIVKIGKDWHFYLRRTKGYRDGFSIKLLQVEDLQRMDMGIAMAHFELTARELGLSGGWRIQEPAIEKPDELTEYTISWVS